MGTVRFKNLARTVGPLYTATSGDPALLTSQVFDSGRADTDWGNISWVENLPTGTDVKFQVATRNSDPDGAWNPSDFHGPSGTSADYYTTPSGEALHSSATGRYLRYRAFLVPTTTATPDFTELRLTMAGDNPWYDRRYSYDARGNMTGKTVLAAAGTTTETRTVNALNQITQNEVDDGSTTTTWTYTWDANGNLATRSDGTEAWTYTFDDDNRLVRVVKTVNSVVILDVAYTYDSLGRMLTRKLSTDTNPTRFEWDGWEVVREVAPDGTETVYYNPDGEAFSFKRGATVYQMHSDELGSIREVTDATGATVTKLDYDAWGNVLPGSFDNVSGGLAYRFVGSFGLRWDSGTQLQYVRQRWYDPELGRFISRDPIHPLENLYQYASQNPVSRVDTLGLQDGGVLTHPVNPIDVIRDLINVGTGVVTAGASQAGTALGATTGAVGSATGIGTVAVGGSLITWEWLQALKAQEAAAFAAGGAVAAEAAMQTRIFNMMRGRGGFERLPKRERERMARIGWCWFNYKFRDLPRCDALGELSSEACSRYPMLEGYDPIHGLAGFGSVKAVQLECERSAFRRLTACLNNAGKGIKGTTGMPPLFPFGTM